MKKLNFINIFFFKKLIEREKKSGEEILALKKI